MVERALILSNGRPLTFQDILLGDEEKQGESVTEIDHFKSLDHVVAGHIRQALRLAKGKIHGPAGAAELLGLNPSTLRHRMRKLGIPHGKGTF